MAKLNTIHLSDPTTPSQQALIDALGRLAAYQPDIVATGNITTQNLVSAGTATANSAVLSGALDGRSAAAVQITGTYTGNLSIQATVDGATWVTIGGSPIIQESSGALSAQVNSATQSIFHCNCAGYAQIRVTGLSAMTGTATVTIRATQGTGSVIIASAIPTGTQTIGSVTSTFTAPTTTNAYLNSAASTNATAVKTSAGTLYHLSASNSDTTDVYVKLYNKASAPTVGTDTPVMTYKVGAGLDISRTFTDFGCRFSTGIAAAITGAAADSDTTAITAAKTKVIFGYA